MMEFMQTVIKTTTSSDGSTITQKLSAVKTPPTKEPSSQTTASQNLSNKFEKI